jgi:hypothetical protein
MAAIRFKQIAKSMQGDYTLNGSITVSGVATFVQTSSAFPAVIVSGSEEIVASTGTLSGSLSIAGLGKLSNTGSNAVIDLGDNSF